jgi:5-methylcytosine-specific restriction endonuclease McrA
MTSHAKQTYSRSGDTPALELRTLVLNADFQALSVWPLSLIPAQEAIKAVYKDRATVVEEWDAVFRSPSREIRAPKIIALKEYVSVHSEPKFCRRSIFLRDKYRCCFCGNRFSPEELTYDHVIPRSKGGKTVWENILTACISCNTKKKNLDAQWSGKKGSGLRPLKEPRRPTAHELMHAGLEFLSDDIKEDFGQWLGYWDVELEP